MNKIRLFSTVFLLLLFALLLAACNMPVASTPTPNLFATLQASTPSSFASPAATGPFTTPLFDFPAPTLMPALTAAPASASIPSPSPADQLTGHIVFTCQVFRAQYADQVCIMNADGSGLRRLTLEDNVRHFYPSLAPDGQSVLYSGFREQNVYEIYSLDLNDSSVDRFTDKMGVLTAPEISPDEKSITFARGNPNNGRFQLMLMGRKGEGADNIPQIFGWDPTWSPDGKQILFASDRDGLIQLFAVKPNGKGLHKITNLPAMRGRSDWSPDGQFIVTYSGEAWNREVYIMNADGSNARQLTPTGGNSQGPSFSPDGKWVAFTAYFDNYGDDHGCEIYIIRVDGTDLRRLTNNDYCDYQPRWGL